MLDKVWGVLKVESPGSMPLVLAHAVKSSSRLPASSRDTRNLIGFIASSADAQDRRMEYHNRSTGKVIRGATE
ncbi:hypothetical protein [Paraburkholderia youngii]|uniref:hypothetical protein n=1 Tax=Paraburkholderia youngii TaxID=2782701 RepID=UPI003D22BCCA